MSVPDVNEKLLETFGLSPIATVVSNPRRADNPLEVANAAFCDLTGYSESEIVGHNCRFLATEPWVTDPTSAYTIRLRMLISNLSRKADHVP